VCSFLPFDNLSTYATNRLKQLDCAFDAIVCDAASNRESRYATSDYDGISKDVHQYIFIFLPCFGHFCFTPVQKIVLRQFFLLAMCNTFEKGVAGYAGTPGTLFSVRTQKHLPVVLF